MARIFVVGVGGADCAYPQPVPIRPMNNAARPEASVIFILSSFFYGAGSFCGAGD
jgi:hypothetical protein